MRKLKVRKLGWSQWVEQRTPPPHMLAASPYSVLTYHYPLCPPHHASPNPTLHRTSPEPSQPGIQSETSCFLLWVPEGTSHFCDLNKWPSLKTPRAKDTNKPLGECLQASGPSSSLCPCAGLAAPVRGESQRARPYLIFPVGPPH